MISILNEDGTFNPSIQGVRITARKTGTPPITAVFYPPLRRLDSLVGDLIDHEGKIVITTVEDNPPFIAVLSI